MDIFGIITPKTIKNMACVPGVPIVGNMHQMVRNPALVLQRWSRTYGDVFQIRMGSRRVVVANSYPAVRQLWLEERAANNSRPSLYTFHDVVSKTQGFTIGTTPWGDSYKRKKKFVASNLNKRHVEEMSELIDAESMAVIERVDKLCEESLDVHLLESIQGYHLRIALFLTYGYSIDYSTELGEFLLKEITHVENKITRLRAHTAHFQDYIPVLRFFVPQTDEAKEYRERRDLYMALLMDEARKRFMECPESDAFVAQAWRLMEQHPDKLTPAELKSACLTMVSAGLDNTPLNFYYCLGMLSQPFGSEIQETAHQELVKTYGSLQKAWERAPYENMRVEYVSAIIKETLRHMTVLPMSLPRETTADIVFRDSVIPKGTLLFMNAYLANHDPEFFPDPDVFEPRRWLDEDLGAKKCQSMTHCAFGLGSRMCAGSHLAYKELYVLLVRFLVRYEISPPDDKEMMMCTDPFRLNEFSESIAIEPVKYLVKLQRR